MPIRPDPPLLDFLPDGCTPEDVVVHTSDAGRRIHVIEFKGMSAYFAEEIGAHPDDLAQADLGICMMAFNSTKTFRHGHA